MNNRPFPGKITIYQDKTENPRSVRYGEFTEGNLVAPVVGVSLDLERQSVTLTINALIPDKDGAIQKHPDGRYAYDATRADNFKKALENFGFEVEATSVDGHDPATGIKSHLTFSYRGKEREMKEFLGSSLAIELLPTHASNVLSTALGINTAQRHVRQL